MLRISKKYAHWFSVFSLILASLFAGCTTSQQVAVNNQPAIDTTQSQPDGLHQLPSQMNRPVPNPITDEIPNAFFRAINAGTRTMSGKPGTNYWRQYAHYDLNVQVIPSDTLVEGSGLITYYNNSPDTLHNLYMELTQNFHEQGVVRNRPAEITGGVHLHNLSVDGSKLNELQSRNDPSGYAINGTQMYIRPQNMILPGDSVKINVSWNFKVPQKGIGGRMGRSQGNLYYIAYWYPQMRVYDDVNGWFTDPFLGNAEFYHDFADYNVNITVPDQWMVDATGSLNNGSNILKKDIYDRLQKAHQSDSVMHVVTKNDFGNVTKATSDGTVTWNFSAKNVRDFAFSVTKQSLWDATRADVGDRDGDGQDDYTDITSIYRESAPKWKHGARYTSDAITFLSKFTGLHYPWPHMTSIEGEDIIGGGMEFPMMTLIGPYHGASDRSFYAVIAHELAHMWVPMQVSNNERRYAWMDEGTTTFNENQAKDKKFPNGPNANITDMNSYLQIAGTDYEGPIMRWSDYHYNPYAYNRASYSKPATILFALRNYLGEETFNKAYHTFLQRWRYKHPYPWDLFNTFEDVTGKNLDWFWRSWYYKTWVLDQAVGMVSSTDNGTRIVIEDRGQVPMPADVEITMDDGSTIDRTIPVKHWLEGATRAVINITRDGQVQKVVIDPDQKFPDADRSNNSWQK
ncbi:MAG TPA: M1 family metallopeptidase [Balneolaceae bacterium]|nr:M1 family metallopeptidase [Balneolaceae bacterium]